MLFMPDEKPVYSGERMSANFQDIETRAVLQLLADVSGRNIVVSDTVQGNVTLRLQSVPWDQALDIVLATKGLDKRQNGNVMIIAPAEEIAAREKADLEARKEIRELEPLVSEFLQVNYAKAADLADRLLVTRPSVSALLERLERGDLCVPHENLPRSWQRPFPRASHNRIRRRARFKLYGFTSIRSLKSCR